MNTKQTQKTVTKKTRILLGLAVLVVLGLATTLFLSPYIKAARTEATLEISMSGWSSTGIYAEVGQPVEITLINLDNRFHTDGGGWHGFTIPAFDVNEQVAPKKTITFSFTPTKTGEFVFYCEICCGGRDNPFMRGKLIVS